MPSQDHENAIDGLLRRSLARDSAARGDCPDAELLAAYFDQALGTDEAAGTSSFSNLLPLPRTTRRNGAAQMQASSFTRPILRSNQLSRVYGQSKQLPWTRRAFLRKRNRAASGARSETKFPERKSPDARWLDLRWLIPVAAMLVLGTFVFMRYASHETTVGVNSQVAMSKSTPPPQDQTLLEPEKKATDTATPEKPAPKAQPSATSAPSRSRSSIASARGAVANPQGNEGAPAPSATAVSRNAPAATSRPSQAAGGRASSFSRTNKSAGAISSANGSGKYQKAASEAAPAAPAPELNASMAKIPVAAASADAVKSPAPAPPPKAATKTQGFGLGGRNINGSAAAKPAAKAKPAEEGYTETVIRRPIPMCSIDRRRWLRRNF